MRTKASFLDRYNICIRNIQYILRNSLKGKFLLFFITILIHPIYRKLITRLCTTFLQSQWFLKRKKPGDAFHFRTISQILITKMVIYGCFVFKLHIYLVAQEYISYESSLIAIRKIIESPDQSKNFMNYFYLPCCGYEILISSRNKDTFDKEKFSTLFRLLYPYIILLGAYRIQTVGFYPLR